MENGTDELLRAVSNLRSGSIGKLAKKRMASFRELGKKPARFIFNELCFCILTANYSSQGGIRVQKAVGNGFNTLSEKRLASKLRSLGYRFPNTRAHYISEARKHLPVLKRNIASESGGREWLVANINGLGYKEASHFLRNTGHPGFAIIDFHIIDLLARHRIIRKPKNRTLSRKRYLATERILKHLANKCGVSLGELDLYLWYLETGKMLK